VLVSLPESSLYAPGVTVPILFPAEKPTCTSATALDASCLHVCASSPPGCAQLPAAFASVGALIVENSIFYASNATNYLTGQNQTSLPAHARFRPLWPPVNDSSVHVEPATVGLPLLPVDATSSFNAGINVFGPGGSPATEWKAALAQGLYERDIVAEYGGFPGLSRLVSVAGEDSFFQVFSDVDQAAYPVAGLAPEESLPVTSESGESLAGFSVYLRDQTTLRQVSSMTTLTDAPQACSASALVVGNRVQSSCLPGFTCVNVGTSASAPVPGCVPLLLTLDDRWPTGGTPQELQVVIEPPAGSQGIPYKADPVVSSTLSAGEVFPAMPPPVTVSGALVGPDGTPVVGSLVIDSTSGAGGGIVTTNPSDPSQPFMHYSTSAQTDAAGNYSVVLPPGTYDVFIAPAPGSNLSATTLTLQVAPALGSGPPVAAGKNLVLSQPGTMTGRAIVADGRLLVGATVQALPAASLAPTTDPRRWPRPATTTTDATGAFSLALDALDYGAYDVVVQPANGTGLPWVTLSDQKVVAGESTSLLFGAPITVPAPMVQDLLLHDPSDNPIVRAVVRAYASTATAKNPTAGAPAPMIEIGSWLTDTSGHVTMLLAQPR
jgi:hypothetical protein